MPSCVVCGKTQSRLNDGQRCKECFSNNGKYPNNNDASTDSLSALSPNWINEPFTNLKGGHLFQIIEQAVKPLDVKLNECISKLTSLEGRLLTVETRIQKAEDDIKEYTNDFVAKSSGIELLKKISLSQQKLCENIQRNNLAKNIIISGIPVDDMTHNDVALTTADEKIVAILQSIGVSLEQQEYEFYSFPPGVGRNTHSAKLAVDLPTKKSIMSKAKCLKETVFNKIYLSNDEPKLTRNENYRLRKKAKDLRISYPEAIVRISKGILTQDGTEVDKFDLTNQIFQ